VGVEDVLRRMPRSLVEELQERLDNGSMTREEAETLYNKLSKYLKIKPCNKSPRFHVSELKNMTKLGKLKREEPNPTVRL